MKLPTLYKRAVDGKKINKWEIEVIGNGYRTIAGFHDGVQTIAEWTYCEGKNIGKKNGTNPEQQALAEATALHKKRKELGFWEDINDCDKKVFFQPMLAHKYEDYEDKIIYPVLSQPKLDGIRCPVKNDGMWSRNGKQIVSAPHIFNSLQPLFEANPDLILDGELYCDKLANDFNKICSIVKKTKPTLPDLLESANTIEYHIYDCPSYEGTFAERYSYLQSLELPETCKLVKTTFIYSKQQLLDQFTEYVAQGYEGQMIRLPKSKYEHKRSKNLLKHKEFITEEYTILDIEEGKGNRSGKAGTAVLQTKDGKIFNSNFKLNWEELEEMWNHKDLYIGKKATLQFANYTPDGIPRFPYIIAIRDYE